MTKRTSLILVGTQKYSVVLNIVASMFQSPFFFMLGQAAYTKWFGSKSPRVSMVFVEELMKGGLMYDLLKNGRPSVNVFHNSGWEAWV